MSKEKTGSIDLHRGKYRLRWTVQGRRRPVGTFASLEQAEIARSAWQIASEDATPSLLIGKWTEEHLERRERARELVDIESEWSRFRTHLAQDPIAAIELHALRRSDVLVWVARVRAKTSAQMTRNVLGVLRGALGAALDAGRIRANVAVRIKVRPERRTEDPWTYLTVPEQIAFLSALDGADRLVAGFALLTGLRAGELVSLRLKDVREDHLVVRYGGVPAKPTKGGRPRTVPLCGPARAALATWLEMLHGYAPSNPHRLLFPRKRGGFRDKNHVIPWHILHGTKKRPGAFERAGITRHVRWHDLRHTFASSLVSGWWGRRWSLEELRAVLGHASITTTQRYAHLADSSVQQAADETAPIWPPRSQGGGNTGNGGGFLNRWSDVQVVSGAPQEIGLGALTDGEAWGRLEADAIGLLRAVARGEAAESSRLAAALRGEGLMRAIQIAEAVIEAAQARRAREVRAVAQTDSR